METYIILSKFTGSARDMDFENNDMTDEYQKAMDAVGAKIVGSWFTLGRFDTITVVEVPNVTAIRALVSSFPANVQTETLRAFPGMEIDEEFLTTLKKVLGR